MCVRVVIFLRINCSGKYFFQTRDFGPNTCQMALVFANYVFPQLDIRKEAGLDERHQAEGSVNDYGVDVFVLFLGLSVRYLLYLAALKRPRLQKCITIDLQPSEDTNNPIWTRGLVTFLRFPSGCSVGRLFRARSNSIRTQRTKSLLN